MKIILVMGLPGAGKATLANELAPLLNAKRLNADEVRKEANDWDFSEQGRKRQSKRMADFALKMKEDGTFEEKLTLVKGKRTKKIVNTIEKISGEKMSLKHPFFDIDFDKDT